MRKIFYSIFLAFAAHTYSHAQIISARETKVNFSDKHAIFQRLETEVTSDSSDMISVLRIRRFALSDTTGIKGKLAELENEVLNMEAQASQSAALVSKAKGELQKIKEDYDKKKGKKNASTPPSAGGKKEAPAPVVTPAPVAPVTPEQPQTKTKKKRKKQ